ncbi:uncharacterized protein N7459_003008 [Penicillium hispanicum]|uniref:uncharacterized protein n=1 Tax=Penicillium hispanicum TaxID=1080232 RepID=UPI0025404E48|nr:uncharacterized protein N7459_003008 [Penicillium hispanicum]KAJ5587243.1 hypothetical protein N7459_003008 [Penicillium hispanicum]
MEMCVSGTRPRMGLFSAELEPRIVSRPREIIEAQKREEYRKGKEIAQEADRPAAIHSTNGPKARREESVLNVEIGLHPDRRLRLRVHTERRYHLVRGHRKLLSPTGHLEVQPFEKRHLKAGAAVSDRYQIPSFPLLHCDAIRRSVLGWGSPRGRLSPLPWTEREPMMGGEGEEGKREEFRWKSRLAPNLDRRCIE